MVGAEAKILFAETPDAFDHQACAGEECESERKLRDDETVAQPETFSRFAGACAFLQRVMQGNIGGTKRGRKSEQQTCGDRDPSRKEQNAGVNLQTGRADLRGDQAAEDAPARLADDQAERASQQRQQQTLCQELRGDLATCGT